MWTIAHFLIAAVLIDLARHVQALAKDPEGISKPCDFVCHHGACTFEHCEDASCPGGGCIFTKCTNPTCTGLNDHPTAPDPDSVIIDDRSLSELSRWSVHIR